MQTNGRIGHPAKGLLESCGGSGAGPARACRALACAVVCALLAAPALAQVAPGGPPNRNRNGAPRPINQPTTQPTGQPNQPEHNGGEAKTGEKGLAHLPTPEPGEDEVTLSAFSEPVELTALVEYVTTTLNINSSTKGQLTGTITFNAPVKVKKTQLLPLLDALLAQYSFTITLDPTGFYMVHPVSDVQVNLDGETGTTRVFPVPNVKPSFLKAAIEAQLGVGGGGAAPNPGSPVPGARGIAYIDELGVIVATDSVRRLGAIDALIKSLLEQYGKYRFIRRELEFVSAPVARERALSLLGANATTNTPQNQNQPNIDPNTGQPIQNQSAGASKSESLPERLSVDPTGNALVFRGTPDEEAVLDEVLKVIDVPNNLEPKSYDVGSSAKQVAEIAKVRGLGEVQLIEKPAENDPNRPVFYNYYNDGQTRQQPTKAVSGGPTMVVDEASGKITYYATPRQHDELTKLITEINPLEERVVIRAYKLKHSDAEKVSQIILGLIENQNLPNDTGTSPLLDTGGGYSRTSYSANGRRSTYYNPNNGANDGELSLAGGPDVFVLPDKSNNQVLVKAPIKQQAEFGRLIEKIDLRRPQVFIEAKIVAVTASDEFRLAFETQLINAGGAGGVLNTNFGLSTFPTGTGLTNPKTVATGLTGLTAALIKSDQIPIALTAFGRDIDTHILSSPQLLVADNEEAEIASIDQQPTQTTTLSDSGSSGSRDVSSYEYVDAGTKLTVKPQISEGGYLRLKYDIELSNFTGTSGAPGQPPPKQKNNVKSDSVTVPTDMTVVVGGVVVSTDNRTVVKVPLLGDIPIVGALFRDDNHTDRKTTLYVFITPRIMRDDLFDDLRLLTEGPQAKSKLDADVPAMAPSSIDILSLPEPTPALSPARDTGKDSGKDKKDASSNGVVRIH